MAEAAEKAGVKAMVNFNYRYVPAVQLAKRLIQEGKIGQIRHWRGVYLRDWIIDPEFPLAWRLRKELAGSGALGDIAAHNIDLARYLVGGSRSLFSAPPQAFCPLPEPPPFAPAPRRGGSGGDDRVAREAAFAHWLARLPAG
jgi:predicted dehydrogenase